MGYVDHNIREFLELGANLTINEGSHNQNVLKEFVKIARRKNTKLTIRITNANIPFLKELIVLGGENLELHL